MIFDCFGMGVFSRDRAVGLIVYRIVMSWSSFSQARRAYSYLKLRGFTLSFRNYVFICQSSPSLCACPTVHSTPLWTGTISIMVWSKENMRRTRHQPFISVLEQLFNYVVLLPVSLYGHTPSYCYVGI